jgi:4-amino-4-deoxy-L-arabinose transferase-like glycosyltransferase
LAAGLLIRLLALPLEGTEDVLVWKTWSYAAVHQGLARMYGVGGHPPVRGIVRWGDRSTTVDYPPVALYELAIVAHIYQAFSPSFANGRWLNAAIKFPGLLAELVLTLFLYRYAARRYGEHAGLWAAAAYWANPAVILAGSVLGYLDALAALPATLAVAVASAGAAIGAGALIAVAILSKLQAIFVLPVVVLALWNASPLRLRSVRTASTLIAALGLSVVVCLPYLLIGAERNLAQGIGSLLRHDMLSADAANLWWIVTYVMRAAYAAGDMGAWSAWTMRLRILGVSTIVGLGYPNPKPLATAAVAGASLWALWRGRRAGDLSLQCAVGAFIVHAYFVVGIAVHENHLYLAIPLLALASTARRALRPVFYTVSAISTLNLFLFFGVGRGIPLPPRNFTLIDSTVLLALANCLSLVWHARVFSAECRRPMEGSSARARFIHGAEMC